MRTVFDASPNFPDLLQGIDKAHGERLFGADHDKIIGFALNQRQQADHVIGFDIYNIGDLRDTGITGGAMQRFH